MFCGLVSTRSLSDLFGRENSGKGCGFTGGDSRVGLGRTVSAGEGLASVTVAEEL